MLAVSVMTVAVVSAWPSLNSGSWAGHFTSRLAGISTLGIVKQPDKLRLKTHALINRLLDLTDNPTINDALIGSQLTESLLNLF